MAVFACTKRGPVSRVPSGPKRLKAATVTSYLSSRNAVTVAGAAALVPRKNDPPGTSRLSQQSPLAVGPQVGACSAQLGKSHQPPAQAPGQSLSDRFRLVASALHSLFPARRADPAIFCLACAFSDLWLTKSCRAAQGGLTGRSALQAQQVYTAHSGVVAFTSLRSGTRRLVIAFGHHASAHAGVGAHAGINARSSHIDPASSTCLPRTSVVLAGCDPHTRRHVWGT